MNEPAFPNEGFNGWGEPFQGMTLRDYFAAKAMQGLIAARAKDTVGAFAQGAYKMADAMMEARNVAQ